MPKPWQFLLAGRDASGSKKSCANWSCVGSQTARRSFDSQTLLEYLEGLGQNGAEDDLSKTLNVTPKLYRPKIPKR